MKKIVAIIVMTMALVGPSAYGASQEGSKRMSPTITVATATVAHTPNPAVTTLNLPATAKIKDVRFVGSTMKVFVEDDTEAWTGPVVPRKVGVWTVQTNGFTSPSIPSDYIKYIGAVNSAGTAYVVYEVN